MATLNLTATRDAEIKIKRYLEENASDVLAEKINNGVRIVKDGKTLINKKTLETFGKYAYEEAKKQAEKGVQFVQIDDDVVFGWAIHYFEEDSIEGMLYNEDGTEFKKPVPVKTVAPSQPVVVTPPKPTAPTLFDLMQKPEPAQTPVSNVQEQLREKIETEYKHPNNPIVVCGMPPTNKPEVKKQESDIYDLTDF